MIGLTGRSRLPLRITAVGTLLLCFHRMTEVMNAIPVDRRRTEVTVGNGIIEAFEPNHNLEPPTVQNRTSSHFATGEQEQTLSPSPASNFSITRRPRRKRKSRKYIHPAKLKVPLPIFVPSLPKSGTTSIHEYFLCGKQNSAHHVYRIDGKVKNKIGRCWQSNIREGRPPLAGCGDHDIWSDTGRFYGENWLVHTISTLQPCWWT